MRRICPVRSASMAWMEVVSLCCCHMSAGRLGGGENFTYAIVVRVQPGGTPSFCAAARAVARQRNWEIGLTYDDQWRTHRADGCCCVERGFLARVRPARGGREFQAARSYSVESLHRKLAHSHAPVSCTCTTRLPRVVILLVNLLLTKKTLPHRIESGLMRSAHFARQSKNKRGLSRGQYVEYRRQ